MQQAENDFGFLATWLFIKYVYGGDLRTMAWGTAWGTVSTHDNPRWPKAEGEFGAYEWQSRIWEGYCLLYDLGRAKLFDKQLETYIPEWISHRYEIIFHGDTIYFYLYSWIKMIQICNDILWRDHMFNWIWSFFRFIVGYSTTRETCTQCQICSVLLPICSCHTISMA